MCAYSHISDPGGVGDLQPRRSGDEAGSLCPCEQRPTHDIFLWYGLFFGWGGVGGECLSETLLLCPLYSKNGGGALSVTPVGRSIRPSVVKNWCLLNNF